MKGIIFRSGAMLASAATLAMTATPAMAQGWGSGGGWGDDYGYRRHNDRSNAGDVIAGILILGGIVAVASAIGNANKARRQQPDNRYPDPQPRRDNPGYGSDDRPQWREGFSVNDAVSRCLGEVSRGQVRADGVESVNREGDGWRVQGRASNGGAFSCSVDRDGRIRNINIDGRAI